MFSTNHSEIEILSRTALHRNGKVAQEFKGKRQKENNVSSVLFFLWRWNSAAPSEKDGQAWRVCAHLYTMNGVLGKDGISYYLRVHAHLQSRCLFCKLNDLQQCRDLPTSSAWNALGDCCLCGNPGVNSFTVVFFPLPVLIQPMHCTW